MNVNPGDLVMFINPKTDESELGIYHGKNRGVNIDRSYCHRIDWCVSEYTIEKVEELNHFRITYLNWRKENP